MGDTRQVKSLGFCLEEYKQPGLYFNIDPTVNRLLLGHLMISKSRTAAMERVKARSENHKAV